MSGITLTDVSFSYGTEKIFSELSFTLPNASITSVLSPSGLGKTTLLNLIAGFLQPSVGSIVVHDLKPTVALKRQLFGYFFQSPTLLPWKTVEENVAIALRFSKTRLSNANLRSRVDEALSLAKIDIARDKYPADLSGGMKARAALARMLAYRPEIWLLDEPFAGLDDLTKESLLTDLQAVISTYSPTIIFVTHNLLDSIIFANRVVVLGASSSSNVAELKLDIDVSLPNRDRALMLDSTEFKLVYQKIRNALGFRDAKPDGEQP